MEQHINERGNVVTSVIVKKTKGKKKVKKPKRKKNPVPNKELYAEIVISKKQGHLTKRAEFLLFLLADGVANKLPYAYIEDKRDCAQMAKIDLFKYWDRFNPEYKNAFAYYTEMAKKGAAKGWNKLYPKKYKGTMSLNSSLNSENSDGIYSV